MTKPTYSCSQAALYQIGRNVFDALSENMTTFSTFRAKYDAAYVTDGIAEIAAAEAILDFQARTAQTEVAYNNLVSQLDVCTDLWQLLKRYIHTKFNAQDQKVRLDEAGASYYSKAITHNWDAATALMQAGINFITNHEATLTANNEMPATFKDKFKAEQEKMIALLSDFQKCEKKVKTDTQDKIAANNQLYKKISEVCLDGQQLFKTNPGMKDQFTFSTLLALVSGTGAAGIRGSVLNNVSKIPLPEVVISSPQWQQTYKSDSDGNFEILRLAAGKYQLQFTCAGYNTFTLDNYEISTGVVRNLTVNLAPSN